MWSTQKKKPSGTKVEKTLASSGKATRAPVHLAEKAMELDEKENPNCSSTQSITNSKKKIVKLKPRDNQGDLRRKWCPVEYCKYHGGKGLVDRKRHFKTHVEEFNHKSLYFKVIKRALEEDECNWTPCVGCKRLVGYTNERDICLQCIDLDEKENVIVSEALKDEVKSYSDQLEKINCTHFKLHKGYPGFLSGSQLLPSQGT